MRTIKHGKPAGLPRQFDELVRLMPPRAISDDIHYADTVGMIDRLMGSGKLTAEQAAYMETLVQLVQAYEAAHCPIEGPGGLASLRHLMDEHGMSASDLARLLGVHVSMGSKILKGDRALTVDHLKKLMERFGVRAEVFMD
jgi:HTH-type transcriptional regulator/antitoxin HigA